MIRSFLHGDSLQPFYEGFQGTLATAIPIGEPWDIAFLGQPGSWKKILTIPLEQLKGYQFYNEVF